MPSRNKMLPSCHEAHLLRLTADAVQIPLPMLVETVSALKNALIKIDKPKKNQRPRKLLAHFVDTILVILRHY